MCMIIVCVFEVQFLINTLGNWLELPPHPLLFSKGGGGAFGIQTPAPDRVNLMARLLCCACKLAYSGRISCADSIETFWTLGTPLKT